MDTFTANCFLLPMGLGSCALIYLSSDDNNVFSPFTDNKSYHREIFVLLLISYFYFLIDSALMIVNYKPSYKIYFVHHLLGLVTIPIVYFGCYDMIKFLISYLTYELSTPFLNISLQYRRQNIINKYTNTIDLLFIITYTIVRIIFGSFLTYKTIPLVYSMDYPIKFLIICPIILQIMIFYWYKKIIKILLIKFKKD
jgi:hypothetical protein